MKWKVPMLPNYLVLRALDHALGAGLGAPLAKFLREPALSVRFRPEVKLYLLDAEALPEHACSRGQKRRALCQGRASKRKRTLLDAIQGSARLHLRVDEGSVGWAALRHAFLKMRVVGSYWWDRPHRRKNDVNLALQKSGLWLTILEATVCFNFVFGPFHGAGHFRAVQGCAQDFFAIANEDSELFMLFYPVLAHDCGTYEDVSHGSPEHARSVFEATSTRPIFRAMEGGSQIGEVVPCVRPHGNLQDML